MYDLSDVCSTSEVAEVLETLLLRCRRIIPRTILIHDRFEGRCEVADLCDCLPSVSAGDQASLLVAYSGPTGVRRSLYARWLPDETPLPGQPPAGMGVDHWEAVHILDSALGNVCQGGTAFTFGGDLVVDDPCILRATLGSVPHRPNTSCLVLYASSTSGRLLPWSPADILGCSGRA